MVNEIVFDTNAHYAGTANNLIKLYNDASEDPFGAVGAFADIRAAIDAAEHFVFIVDWSFHPRMTLRRSQVIEPSIGDTLLRKAGANRDMLIAIMPWLHSEYLFGSVMPTNDRANNAGPKTLVEMNGGRELPPNLLYQLAANGRTGAWSHHQKFVVLDAPATVDNREARVVKVFYGGLDLTRGRFDWPEHPLWNPNSVSFSNDWYNGEFGHDLQMMREPWHDIHAQLVGPSAWDFAFEFVGRWASLRRSPNVPYQKIADLYTRGPVLRPDQVSRVQVQVPGLAAGFRAQVLRSLASSAWKQPEGVSELDPGLLKSSLEWSPVNATCERSIQDAYVTMIQAAERFVYIESQYLISSGDYWSDTVYGKRRSSVANTVAYMLVQRIIQKIQTNAQFHVYIVLPMYPEGNPQETGTYSVRYLQWCTIEYMIKAVAAACEGYNEQNDGAELDWTSYLSFFCLANWSNVFPGPEHVPQQQPGRPDWSQLLVYGPEVRSRKDKLSLARRYMIYVHSKMMIVDDNMAIIGSANLNQRSLDGNRDSEIAVALWTDDTARPNQTIGDFRRRIWTEHLGDAWMREWVFTQANGNLEPNDPHCVQAVGGAAQHNFVYLMRGERTPDQGHLIRWPVLLRNGQLVFDPALTAQVPNDCIPDYPEDDQRYWRWVADWTAFGQMFGVGEIAE